MKDEIRKKLKIKRKYFQNYRRQTADEMMASDFLAAYGGFNSFFIYNSFGAEAGTALIVSELLKADKRVYMPRVEGNEIVPVLCGDAVKGAFGVYEPTGASYGGDIDVTVVPLLAVNSRGYRIGYGKGYYDRFFKKRDTLRVGLGYAFQMEDFTEDEWDEPLDAFVCEKGIYYYEKPN